MAKKTCKNCIHMQQAQGEFICANADSEYLADYVDLKHSCDDWESKRKEEDE